MNAQNPTEASRRSYKGRHGACERSCFILLVAISLSLPTVADARVSGGSNLGSGGYSSHRCHKPTKPSKPDALTNQWRVSQWEINAYNSSVRSYNAKLEIYNDCITRYVENANNDIEQIRQKAEKARSEAND
jgi:hypothetical protein